MGFNSGFKGLILSGVYSLSRYTKSHPEYGRKWVKHEGVN